MVGGTSSRELIDAIKFINVITYLINLTVTKPLFCVLRITVKSIIVFFKSINQPLQRMTWYWVT